MSATHASRNAKGGALLVVLWCIIILSIVVLNFAAMVQTDLRVASHYTDRVILSGIAAAGVERAAAELANDADATDSLSEAWYGSGDYKDVTLSEGRYSLLRRETEEDVFGIEDEAAKVNLCKADKDTLLRLPGMTDALAAAIVEWQATFTSTATGETGAPAASYFPSKGEELYTLDELLLLPGCDAVTLYGEDWNRNGELDPAENDGDATPPRDTADGILDHGLAPYVTLWSRDRNVTSTGAPHVDLNTADASQLKASLPNLTDKEAAAIVSHREKSGIFERVADLLKVVQPPEEQPRAEGRNGRRNNEPRRNETPQPSRENVPRATGEQPQQPQQPQPEQPEQPEQPKQPAFSKERFVELADFCSVGADEWIDARININTAPREVLGALGLSDEQVASVMARREEGPFPSVVALLDLPGLSQDTFVELSERLTVRSFQFRVECVAKLENSEATMRTIAVLERDAGRVQILYWNEN